MKINRVKVKEAMEKQGINTQVELAKRLGISKNQLSVMLSEKYKPLKTKVEELCNVLDVNESEIIDLDRSEVSDNDTLSSNKPTAIELFAGAGGLALGLEKTGIDTMAFVEMDKYCCATLKENRPHWNIINEDIAKVDFSFYSNKVDIVTGGFPCQAFSYTGEK